MKVKGPYFGINYKNALEKLVTIRVKLIPFPSKHCRLVRKGRYDKVTLKMLLERPSNMHQKTMGKANIYEAKASIITYICFTYQKFGITSFTYIRFNS